jgi:hypothetical protein
VANKSALKGQNWSEPTFNKLGWHHWLWYSVHLISFLLFTTKITSIGMSVPFLSSVLTSWKGVLKKRIVAQLLLEYLIYSSLPQILFISEYSVTEIFSEIFATLLCPFSVVTTYLIPSCILLAKFSSSLQKMCQTYLL